MLILFLIEMKKIDTSNWGEFQIKDLFDVKPGKRLTKANMIAGDINFIGASSVNNGVTAKIGNTNFLHQGNTITVNYNGSVGEAFYQEERFWASDDVKVLYPKFAMDKPLALFLIPIIKCVGHRYAFVDKWVEETMRNDIIKPPVDSEGNPDFAYMKNYMTNIIEKQRANLNALQMLKQG